MIFYPKIQNLYKIDKGSNKCLQPVFSDDIFSDIKNWQVFEKLDGQNVCIRASIDNGIEIYGKKKDTLVPEDLKNYIKEKLFYSLDFLNENSISEIYLYGEGIGDKIENGKKYSKQQIFVLFDVFYKNKFHDPDDIERIANYFKIPFVPLIKEIKLDLSVLINTVDILKLYNKSSWGNFENEGLILKPKNFIKNENNQRVMAKIRRENFLLK